MRRQLRFASVNRGLRGTSQRIVGPGVEALSVESSIGDEPGVGGDGTGGGHVDDVAGDGREGVLEVLDGFDEKHALPGGIDAEVGEDAGCEALATFTADDDVEGSATKGGDVTYWEEKRWTG